MLLLTQFGGVLSVTLPYWEMQLGPIATATGKDAISWALLVLNAAVLVLLLWKLWRGSNAARAKWWAGASMAFARY